MISKGIFCQRFQGVVQGNGADGVLDGQCVAVGLQLVQQPGVADHAGTNHLAAAGMDGIGQFLDLLHVLQGDNGDLVAGLFLALVAELMSLAMTVLFLIILNKKVISKIG